MNTKTLCAISTSVLAAACVMQTPNGPGTDICQPMPRPIPPVCQNTNQVVTLNVQAGLTVAPPNVCAYRGTPVNFQVTPPNTDVVVVVVPKDPADTWLNGINRPTPADFHVNIPGTVPESTDHDYYIVTSNGYCYDPRVHVNP